jgi:hypothetical protein
MGVVEQASPSARSRVKRFLRTAVAVLVAVVALPSAAEAAGWSLQTTPSVPGGTSPSFASVSCGADSSCEAVGSFVNSNGKRVALAESWDGHGWTVQEVPLPEGFLTESTPDQNDAILESVSCASASACIAVGAWDAGPNAAPFAERWNGQSWTEQDLPPSLGDSDFGQPRATGVSCPSVDDCQTVGNYNSPAGLLPRADGWNGSRWTSESISPGPLSPSGDYAEYVVQSLYCVSSSWCAGVGSNESGALVDVWEDGRWKIQSAFASGGALSGVWCWSAASCVAIGGRGLSTLAERWNGERWSAQPSANIGASDTMNGLACAASAPAGCVAIGTWRPEQNGPTYPLAESWNGTGWTRQAMPSGISGQLNSISCTSDRTCIAVGSSGTATLAESYVAPSGVPPSAPSVSAGRASKVTGTAAVLSSTVRPNGSPLTSCVVRWGAAAGVYTHATRCTLTAPIGSASVKVSVRLTHLVPGTYYEYRVQATNADGSRTGAERQFVTRARGNRFTLGNASIGDSTGSFPANLETANEYNLYEPGVVRSLSVYLQPTSTWGAQAVALTLYGDWHGTPGRLLAITHPFVFKSADRAGWYTLPVRDRVRLPKGQYWLGVMTGNRVNVAGFRYDDTGTRDLRIDHPFSTGPTDPFLPEQQDSAVMSLYASVAG